ncbi:MAG TPA: carboxypeptidase regulatory-like domain-containing protein [Terriglobales bacterium]
MRPRSGRFLANVLAAVALLCVTLFLATLTATEATAQQATAKIVGIVTDQQGAVVPGVKITVTNTATNVSTAATTDKGGFYQALNLPIGTYRVTARQTGFRPLEVLTTPLEINQSFRVDMKLEVGAASEQVLVESQSAGVETVNPTLGESVTSRPIVDMPLNGRNVLSLALLQPGVTEDNPDDGSTTQGFNIGGGRTDSVTYLLDGGLNNELLGNGVVLNPNPDSIAEFRILTSNYGAEYGRNGAGIISVVTKSGSNTFHGSAFDFVRNTDFDANSYFNNEQVPALPRNNLKRNQFGGTLGGPIIKNKLFFFTSYQGQRQVHTEVEQEQQIFTTPELNGDFSQAGPNGGPDPNVVAFLQTNTYFQSNPTLQNQGIIDPTKFDPAAQAYIASGVIPSNATGEIFPSAGSTDNNNELDVKIDFNIDSKDKLTGTVGGIRRNLLEPFGRAGYSGDVPGFPSTFTINNYFLNLAYTRTISPSMLNELRGTAQRHNTLSDKPVSSLPAISAFGIASDLSNGPPLMSFDNGLYFGQDQSGPATEIGNTFGFTDTFTWVKGNSTWKFGAGFSAYQQNTLYAFFTDSNFAYYGYASGGDGTGNSLADFLVGAPNDLFEGPNAISNFRSKNTYAFGQDEWRVRPNLTLTLGLRYEFSTPKIDTQGRTFSIIPGDQSIRFPDAPLGLVFPGDPGAPRGSNFPDKDNFAPRFGFAYSPGTSNKTSIRGGIGLFYDVLKGEDNLQFNGAPPFYSEPYVVYPCLASSLDPTCATLPVTGPQQQLQPGVQPTVWTSCSATAGLPFFCQPWANSTTPLPANPFPSQPPSPLTAFNTTGNSPFLPFGGGGIYFVNPHLHTPYTYQYNLSIQHELARNLIAEVSYVGSSSKGLTSLYDINPFDLSTISGSNPARFLNETQNATLSTYCSGAGGPSDCPFSSALEFSNLSFANFNSLEASITKQNSENRYLGNTYFTLGYTYGHSLDNSSGFRNRDSQMPYYNHSQFYGSSDFDVKERITFSGGWDLPFDRAFGSAPKRLVKGWSLYPILSWRTGFPLSISSGLPANPSDPGPSGAGDGYLALADFAPGFNKITILNPRKNGNYYFNPAAFQPINDVYNPADPYGTTGRDFFRGPGRTNLDMTLSKNTAITERVNVEIRMDAFNVFNHGEFANPDTNLFDGTFGQITTTTFGTSIVNPPTYTERIVQLAGRLTF